MLGLLASGSMARLSVAARLPATAPATAPTTAPAPVDTPGSHSPEVDVLLSQLADPHWQIRNRAVDRLVQFGSPIERQLREARNAARTVDLRTRLEMVLNRIHESRRSGTSYVSLHVRSAPTRDALTALEHAADVKFDVGAGDLGDGGSITLDADHAPFWTVLRSLCAQAKLEISSIDSAGVVAIRGGDDDWGRRPAAIEGPYMLLARRIELTRSLDPANPKDVSTAYTLALLAYAEPKLRPIYWSIRGVDPCITDSGKRLEPVQQDDAPEIGDLNTDNETHLQFTGPPDIGHRIPRLRLNARFILSDKSEPVEVANVLKVKNQTRTIGGFRVLIKGVTKGEDERYSAALTVYRDDHPPDEWAERMGLLDRAPPRLADANGKGLDAGGTSLNEGAEEWNWSDEFTATNADSRPAKLLWDFPIATRHADVAFEFKDLPLP